MTLSVGFGSDQPMAGFLAEGGYVEARERIAGEHHKPVARSHSGEPLARPEHGQRAVESPEVEDQVCFGERQGQPPNIPVKRLPIRLSTPGCSDCGAAVTTGAGAGGGFFASSAAATAAAFSASFFCWA